ncbi:MAG: pantoate kinase [Promethearchaeota archaeon]
MSEEVTTVTVRVPHRISGFFQVVESERGRPLEDLAKVGSKGGGPALTAWGTTTVAVRGAAHKEEVGAVPVKIVVNDEDWTDSAATTQFVASQLLSKVPRPASVLVNHQFDLPIGCGFGASGAGALGTAIALSVALGLPSTLNAAGKIAHVAEVMNKTGLGTVGGQLVGGLSITTEAGYPFTLDKLVVPPDLRVVCGSFGPVSTTEVLSSWEYKEKISKYGAWALEKLLREPNVRTFMEVSREFVERVGLLDALHLDDVAELLAVLDRVDSLGASMNQLGRSVFCFCRERQLDGVLEAFSTFRPSLKVYPLRVCHVGPELMVCT